MEARLNIITLGVKDLKIAHHFYSNILGWEPHSSTNEGISFFKLNGLFLSLYPEEKLAEDALVSSGGSGFKKFSLALNSRSEKEVDDLFSVLKSRGVIIAKNPEKAFWGGYSGYFKDPDGNLWEVAFNPFLELDEQGNVK